MWQIFFSTLISVSTLAKLLVEKLMEILLRMDNRHDASVMC